MNSWTEFLNEITPGDLNKDRGDASRAAAIERLRERNSLKNAGSDISNSQPAVRTLQAQDKENQTMDIIQNKPSGIVNKPISQHDQAMNLNKFKDTKLAGADNTSTIKTPLAKTEPSETPTSKWGDLLHRGKQLASDTWDKTKEETNKLIDKTKDETSELMHKKLGKIGDTDIEGSHAAAAGIAGLAAGAGALGLRKLLSKKK